MSDHYVSTNPEPKILPGLPQSCSASALMFKVGRTIKGIFTTDIALISTVYGFIPYTVYTYIYIYLYLSICIYIYTRVGSYAPEKRLVQ